ncbi:MAG: hypothetical protein Q9204_002887, partial [Flavoplaca sp. TL-2023a]
MREEHRSAWYQQRVRTRASKLRSQTSGNNQAQEWNISLVDLPPEVLDTIVELLPKTDMANLAAVSKAFKASVESKFWRKIKSRIGTPRDTAGLVDFLTVRPDIIPMIRALVLDEYHPSHTRRLLSIKMPEVHSILILHAGEPIKHVSEREKRALNRSLVQQPKLTN